jgi:hypothetical protein
MNISYEKLDILNFDEVLKGLCFSMAKYEPMGIVLDLESDDLVSFFEPIIRSCVETSFIAKDIVNNRIAGAIICNDFNYFTNLEEENISKKDEPIEYLLKTLESSFMKSEYYIRSMQNHTFYQYATYVSPDYGNQGIASNLYKISEKYAIGNNYKNIFTISSGPISQHIRINKLGFKFLHEIDYKTFQFNGINVFSDIKQVDTCKSLVKLLNNQINE